jgi:DNA-binding CsgD family transcriptional regulator
VQVSLGWGQELIESICRAKAVEQRFDCLTKSMAMLGIDQVNYGYLDPAAATEDQADVLFLSSMDTGWLDFYSDRGLQAHDPYVKSVRAGIVSPYRWGRAELVQLNDAPAKQAALLIADAGIVSSIFVPLCAPAGALRAVAGVTFGSTLQDDEFQASTSGLSSILTAAAHLFHERSRGPLRRERFGIRPLSPRERDCLTLMAMGYRADRIAERLGLARVTVELHLRQGRVKLKARTMPEAVARALQFNEIALDW